MDRLTLADIEAARRELVHRGIEPTHRALADHFGMRATKTIQRALKRTGPPSERTGAGPRPGTREARPTNSRGTEARQARPGRPPNLEEPDWSPPPPIAELPPDGRLEIVYGYRGADPIRGRLGLVLVAGDRGSGKSALLAWLLQQAARMGARLVIIDLHADVSEQSLTRRLGRDPSTVARDRASALATIGRVRALLDRRLTGDPDRSPVVLVVDEYPAMAYPPTPDSRAAVADLVRIGQEGRKVEVHLWLGTASTAGEGSGLPQVLRNLFGIRVLLQLTNSAAVHAAGRPLRSLPEVPDTLTAGRGLLKVPELPDYVAVRFPLPTPDGTPAGPPADLPDVDVMAERLARERDVQHAQGAALEVIERAADGIRDVDGAGPLRRALEGAARAVRGATEPGQLRAIVDAYRSDIEAAAALAPPARAAAPRRLAAPSPERRGLLGRLRDWWDGKPDDLYEQPSGTYGQDDDDQDEPDRATPRELYVLPAPEPEPADVQAEALDLAWRRPHLGATMWHQRRAWPRTRTSAELLDAEAERERGAR